MRLLAPLAGLFALTIPAIVALYFLRIRRPVHPVSSTLLWRRAVRDMQASVPWQRLRPSLLLLLQVATACALVLGLMRPAAAAPSPLGRHTIIVLDTSAPMQATDVSPSRFEEARRRARAIVDRMGPDNRVTLIQMDSQPRELTSSTGDSGPLKDALAHLAPSAGVANLAGSLALALAAGGDARDTTLVLLSDGVTDSLASSITLPFAIDFPVIGSTGENLAITALAITGDGSHRQAAVHITNLGRQHHHTTVEVRGDNILLDAHPADVDPGAGADVAVVLPAGVARVQAELTPHDQLSLDDVAVAVAGEPRIINVTLVTARNLFLQQALALRPDVRVTTVTPSAFTPRPDVDLYVFDGVAPPSAPTTPYWVVNPPAGTLGSGAEVAAGAPRPAGPDDPLLTDVDLSQVHIARTHDLRSSPAGRSVIESVGGPLLTVSDAPPRHAVLGFDLHDSDLPLRTAFPVLVDHLSAFLVPPVDPPRSHLPGEPVQITDSGLHSVDVTRPDGSHETIPAEGGSVAVIRDTDQLGAYAVTENRTGSARQVSFAVNLFDPLRSTIQPRPDLPLHAVASSGSGSATHASNVELWPFVVILVLALLALEWWVYHRAG